jgi:hypothetical protein
VVARVAQVDAIFFARDRTRGSWVSAHFVTEACYPDDLSDGLKTVDDRACAQDVSF